MSFILDALRKSEAERQKQDAPGFVHVPDGSQRKSTRKWVWLVAGLVAVNLAALAVVLLRPDRAVNSIRTNTPTNTIATTPATDTVTDVGAQPITIQPNNNAESAAGAVQQQIGANRPVTANPVTSYDVAPTEPVSESFATFNNLRAQGVLSLPDMHLDIHVYSGQPEDRFVFINMSKYKERNTLTEGPLVKEITPQGVILEYGSTVFLLPRE
jgi:general secretion pathway protein B